ncbi:MAG: phosphatase PAP2 family protein [Flavobacteriaceae bacterium]|nr:phosphatase PAP2 family protein [Flavobacteriaceae bacterium]
MKTESIIYFFIKLGFIFILFIGIASCKQLPKKIPDYEVAAKWADMTLYITKNTPANSPTFASRCLGYMGLAQYEAVVHGTSDHKSLAGQLNQLESLPIPNSDDSYNWLMVLNRSQSELLKSLYLQTADENKLKIDSLENRIQKILEKNENRKTTIKSIAYGTELAKALFDWSKTDGGHRGYLKNFDQDFNREPFPGSWKPPLFAQSFSHKPLHSFWGENRTFAPQNTSLELPEYIDYDPVEGSEYYNQFLSVYQKKINLTLAEKEAAIWWSDDPDVTFSPGGHLYYITNSLIRRNKPNILLSAKTFALVGMSVADAFIKCWKWKYHFFSERPNTFVPEFIDKKWESFWPDPPFPSFPSGHAIQASAAVTALLNSFENNIKFIDSAHVGRERDRVRNIEFKARSYSSIWSIAQETADSRFYGGIHTPQDNEVGLEQGTIIAENIINLKWKK